MSWKLFVALLVATTLGSTFFAGVTISSDIVSKQALNQVLGYAPVDYYMTAYRIYYPQDFTRARQSVSTVDGVSGAEVFSKGLADLVGNMTGKVTVAGIQNNSIVAQGMKIESGTEELDANETYVWTGSRDFSVLSMIGKVINLNFTIIVHDPNDPPQLLYKRFSWSLKVKGAVSMSDRSLAIVREQFYGTDALVALQLTGFRYYYPTQNENIFVVSWEKTFSGILVTSLNLAAPESPSNVHAAVIASVDRDRLISPYDTETAEQTLINIADRIGVSIYLESLYLQSLVLNALRAFRTQLSSLRLSFFILSIPVFILAWYMGDTAAEISFNLRRREIGLLSTRGFTKRSITKLFIIESILIGLLSGVTGFLIATLTVTLALGSMIPPGSQGLWYTYQSAGIQTIALTMGFGIILAIFSVLAAARRAANVKTIDALKEYAYLKEREKPQSTKLVWVIFLLGAYKIVAWMVGLNLSTLYQALPDNVIIYYLFSFTTNLDSILNVIGPVLFLYGAVKLIMQGSVKFQRKVGSIGRKLFKESGALATKNAQRNPARTATVAFLIALVVGYGVYAVGASTSNSNYVYRLASTDVGADVSAQLAVPTNSTYVSNMILNITGVSDTTLQRVIHGSSMQWSMTLKVIDPTKWRQVAYYEDGWFRGSTIDQAFQSMINDDSTIVLDSTLAEYFALKINDSISITIATTSGSNSYLFRIVSFLGPEPTGQMGMSSTTYSGTHWSYIPAGFLNQTGLFSSQEEVLVRLVPAANITYVLNRILGVDGVSYLRAVSLEVGSYYSNSIVTGPQIILNTGVGLAVVGASLETAIIVFIVLYERRKEIGMLSIRGMSFRQISSTLLIELLSITGFALTLGTLVGLVMALGAANSITSYSPLVAAELVLPLYAVLLILSIIVLVISAVIVPVLVAAKKAPSNIRKTGG